MAVQKKSVVPPSQGPLSSHNILNQQRGTGPPRIKQNGVPVKPNSQTFKTPCPVATPPRVNAVSNGPNIDERLKAARERREEQQKLLASREQSRLQREQRARRYHEQQLQERQKKLQEQRLKEEKRRSAVEEKRKQKLQEEKERYESAVRKTIEKAQRAQQNQQNARGRKTTKNVSFHSISSTAGAAGTTPRRVQQPRSSASPSPVQSQHRGTSLTQVKAPRQTDINKKQPNVAHTRSSTTKSSNKSPVATQSTAAPPSPRRTIRRSVSRHSPPLQPELPSVPEEDAAVCVSALSPRNSRPVRTSAAGPQEKTNSEPETPCSDLPSEETERESPVQVPLSPAKPDPPSPEVASRLSAGTTDRVEASRLLAEKRREARLQREREEQERLQREETERRAREELERRRAEEEQARQRAEAQRLIEEKMRREEEEKRRAEEERAQAMREAALLQKKREEEQAREKAKADQIKREREILAQKEEADRQDRKKRLEEIMRRTRRTSSTDKDPKSVSVRILPKENTQPVHNGSTENTLKLPVVSLTSQLGGKNEEDMVPVVAFKERRSLRSLTGLEDIQTHQRAEVI